MIACAEEPPRRTGPRPPLADPEGPMDSPNDVKTRPHPDAERTSWLQLGVVSASEFVVWMGFGAIIPFLPIFLKEQAHSSLTLWAVIASMFYVGTLLFSSPLGWLSDTIGRKPVMIAGGIVYTVAVLLFTTTTDPHWFIVFRLLEGIGTAAFGPAAQAFVADITTEKNRSKAYGFLTTAQFGGLIFGPALAAPLYQLAGGGKSGFYAIFYFGAALSAISLVAVIVLVREPAALKKRRAQRSRDRAGGARHAGRPAEALGERRGGDDLGRLERHGPFDQVLQLADVAGPRPRFEQLHRLGRDPLRQRSLVAADFFEEVLHEVGDVVAPLAKGRDGERDHVDPVEEVLAEAPFRHFLAISFDRCFVRRLPGSIRLFWRFFH